MHVNPKHKWCMKKNFGQKHRNWKFFSCDRSRINRTSIESGSLTPKILIAISINRKTGSIDRKSGKIRFLKTKHFNAKTTQSTLFYKKNTWVWDEKFFKNTWIQPKSSKIKIFNQFVLKAQTLNTFCIKIKELLILDDHNKITHNIKYQI